MKLTFGETTITFGSVYGPNHDDVTFFDRISMTVRDFGSDYVILGGDWNTTYDGRNSRQNIDVLNNVSIPSARRSDW